MSTTNSNAPQRNRAIRNATLLVLLLMLLAGVGGAFYPMSKYQQNQKEKEDFTSNLDSLKQVGKNYQDLIVWLTKAKQQYAEIEKRDKEWGTAHDQAGLKREIRGLEDGLSDLVNALNKESKDSLLAPAVAEAYASLITARGLIWKWREKSTLPPSPPPPPGDPVGNLKQRAWIIASDIDKKAADIQTVVPKIRRDKNDKNELERYVNDLKKLGQPSAKHLK